MTSNKFNPFEGLEEDLHTSPKVDSKDHSNYLESAAPFSKPKRENNYDCEHCGGKGTYKKRYFYSSGEVKTFENKCFKCNGRGGFSTSPEQRNKARIARKQKKANEKLDNLMGFAELRPEIWEHLNKNKTIPGRFSNYSSFCDSLLEGVAKFGDLTENQIASVERSIAKSKKWEKEKGKPKTNLDLSVVRERLLKGKENLKKPVIRAGDTFKFSFAPEEGKNRGFIYVKHHDDYIGKIAENGDYFPYKASKQQIDYLEKFAKDPVAELKLYGDTTGKCGFCSRRLTVKESVKRGYGPTCADNFGLPYNHTEAN